MTYILLPRKCNITNHTKNITSGLDDFNTTYDNIIILGDFNVEPEESRMSDFLNIYNMKNLVKEKTCYKNPKNPSCVDLIITNCPRGFQNTTAFETGLTGFHKMTATVLKSRYPKQKPNIVNYRKELHLCYIC